MVQPQCAICQCYVTSGRCWICKHCRVEFTLGTKWADLPEWVRYLVHEEQNRRRERAVTEIDYSDLCYADRVKVEMVVGGNDES